MERFAKRAQCVALMFAAAISFGCKQKEKFPDLGSRFSGPDAVAVSDSGTHFYVLNTDFERFYNKGSIVVLDEAGNKVNVVETPRMGRMLRVAGNYMLAGFDRIDTGEPTEVILYNVADPANPVKMQSWLTDAAPVNAAMVKGYNHFAVTLSNGQLLLGTFEGEGAPSLTKVRDYGIFRRALYLDPNRELLFAFTTDFAAPSMEDRAGQEDSRTFDLNGVLVANVPNDVPDGMEQDIKAVRAELSNRQLYQFVIYDIGKERAAGFPHRLLGDLEDKTVDNELRWLYFTLTSQDGIPDNMDGYENPFHQTYRTNIWDAAPDPEDPDAFYFSQRGGLKGSGQYANNVVHARITGSPAVKEGKVPRTSTYLSFERAYGFAGEVNERSYPGNIDVKVINNLPVLMVTDSRDQVYWKEDNLIYSLTAKNLDGTQWYTKLATTDHQLSYTGVVVNQRGIGVSASYYGSRVATFKVVPGVDITDVRTIE